MGNHLCWYYFNRPNTMAVHNLCTTIQPPFNYKSLLGLGLNFCPIPKFTNYDINSTIQRFRKDMVLKMITAGNEITYTTKFYPKTSRTFSDKLVPENYRKRIDVFLHFLRKEFKKKKTKSNLLTYQNNLLTELSKSKQHIILRADKNLGPCILETNTYISRCLNDHLLDKHTYQQLSQREALGKLTIIKMITEQLIRDYSRAGLDKKTIRFLKTIHPYRRPFS